MIGIIDYGMGNLMSVKKAFEELGFRVKLMKCPEDLTNVNGLVLPGVGAFGDAIKNLTESAWVDVIKEAVAIGMPFLGICLGMQLLFSESFEGGYFKGLDLIKGSVKKFDEKYIKLKVPHIGWNGVKKVKNSQLLSGIPDNTDFYFVHSYYCDPEEDVATGITDYGAPFVSCVEKENIYGVQFHPEKSSRFGLQILKNFGEMSR
ncbi:imidazole glycerol phosphate synthase subunit HisH [Thermoanaerobacterium sp. DL9XJH110]|uniref:imidazole glycerol phosphate synthase subunit HisH n=1 Tax=Thermoanaerobacterium sp. DL9XJH110 TaxID=3386643 RepID=UPI003BB4CE4E